MIREMTVKRNARRRRHGWQPSDVRKRNARRASKRNARHKQRLKPVLKRRKRRRGAKLKRNSAAFKKPKLRQRSKRGWQPSSLRKKSVERARKPNARRAR
jgi:hypothetical protein